MKIGAIPLLMAVMVSVSCSKKKEQTGPVTPPTPTDTTTDNPHQKKWIVTTIAGNGEGSFVNGGALSATFHFPADLVITQDGSIYVSDAINFCIRKISGGQVSTYAGGTGFDIMNGSITSALFKTPFSITVDENGNLFTTDDNDPRIRKISVAKEVSTYAGSPLSGFIDGNSDTARLGTGDYIISDSQGNLFVSESQNNTIRKINSSGIVTTVVAGYHFASPTGIAIDSENNLYVANRLDYNILKIGRGGNVSVFAGIGTPGFKDGNSTEAQFSADMHDLAIDKQGNLYLSDDNRIRKITSQGVVSTIAGSDAGFSDGEGGDAKFNFPNGLAVDGNDNLFVADLNNHRIRKIVYQ